MDAASHSVDKVVRHRINKKKQNTHTHINWSHLDAAVFPSLCGVASILPNITSDSFWEHCLITSCSAQDLNLAEIRHPVSKWEYCFWRFVYIRNKKCVWHRNLWMDGAESRHWHSRPTHYRFKDKQKKSAFKDSIIGIWKDKLMGVHRWWGKTILHNFNFRPIRRKRQLNEVAADFTFLFTWCDLNAVCLNGDGTQPDTLWQVRRQQNTKSEACNMI